MSSDCFPHFSSQNLPLRVFRFEVVYSSGALAGSPGSLQTCLGSATNQKAQSYQYSELFVWARLHYSVALAYTVARLRSGQGSGWQCFDSLASDGYSQTFAGR